MDDTYVTCCNKAGSKTSHQPRRNLLVQRLARLKRTKASRQQPTAPYHNIIEESVPICTAYVQLRTAVHNSYPTSTPATHTHL